MPNNVTQSPIYQSFSMLHPDGTLMCHCNEKKAKWYIERDLAEWIDEKTFKLRFEPQGYGKSDNPYYTQKMENKCVCCGSEDELNKHHVVPYVFRSRFPVEYKENNHHDIVAICVDCHEDYETHATLLKTKLAKENGLSMGTTITHEQKMNKKIKSAKQIIDKLKNGLLVDNDNRPVIIPDEKLIALKKMAEFELLEESPINAVLWADKIVEKVLLENKLFDFVKMWRMHFIEIMNPQNLPEYWNVDHPLEVSNKSKIKGMV